MANKVLITTTNLSTIVTPTGHFPRHCLTSYLHHAVTRGALCYPSDMSPSHVITDIELENAETNLHESPIEINVCVYVITRPVIFYFDLFSFQNSSPDFLSSCIPPVQHFSSHLFLLPPPSTPSRETTDKAWGYKQCIDRTN